MYALFEGLKIFCSKSKDRRKKHRKKSQQKISLNLCARWKISLKLFQRNSFFARARARAL